MFSGTSGWVDGRRDERERGESGGWKKSGEDVMAVVKSGGKWGVLEARGGKGMGAEGGGGKRLASCRVLACDPAQDMR